MRHICSATRGAIGKSVDLLISQSMD